MKKLLILGGDSFTVPVVKAAKAQGYYVITCDYLPHNIAHKYSDQYLNFSTTDKEGILKAARNIKIDGIVTYTDSGVVTCAYVAHHLGLPMTGPLDSVEILQNKARFRKFLRTHGFNVPNAKGYSSAEEALKDMQDFELPVIVKPVDAAGSKGVTKVVSWDNLPKAIEWAIKYSFSGEFIIESWIEKKGASSDSDSFSYNGKLVIATFSAQWFDETAAGPYVPAAYSWPSTFTHEQESYLKSEIQRLLTLLEMQNSVYNIETRIGTDDKPYIMEVSPRGGGNRLSEMVRLSTGVDLITNAVRVAVGDQPVDYNEKQLNGYWAEIILHSRKSGKFNSLTIDQAYQPFVKEIDLWKNEGDRVEAFRAARDAIGTLILKFDTQEQLTDALRNTNNWITINLL